MTNLPQTITRLRLLVGFLGEKPQLGWWASNFLGPSSEAFLTPVFSRSTLLAQCRGVCEAALRVHDERIGVGSNYHLFRLPDAYEREAATAVSSSDFKASLGTVLQSVEAAQQAIKSLAVSAAERSEGPTHVGHFDHAMLDDLLRVMAGHYSRAFDEGYQCFPYLREA